MLIREPLVHATYYYLREGSGESSARGYERHTIFVEDAHRMLQSVAGWLAMPAPTLPAIAQWEAPAPSEAVQVMQMGELRGQTNAYAWMAVYVLRNMLLLNVAISRAGEHEQTVWPMLEEALGRSPTTPTWLHTARYWCGVAPRPPIELEHDHLTPMQTPFGVLCRGQSAASHVLVYPDARTEQRANAFLNSLAMKLDWYPVQAHYCLESYEDHVSSSARAQRDALDKVSQAVQPRKTQNGGDRPGSLAALHSRLSTLETAHDYALNDLAATEQAAREMQNLAAGYRLKLMECGLWDAAPTVWQSQVAELELLHARIAADVRYIETTARRMEILLDTLQTRVMLLNADRERWLAYVVAAFGVALLAVLVVDTSLTRVLLRLVALAVVAGIVWMAWQMWQRRGGDTAA